ncbi:hypothetical protein OSTOST_08708, partial [Ostertagia ostertagi]
RKERNNIAEVGDEYEPELPGQTGRKRQFDGPYQYQPETHVATFINQTWNDSQSEASFPSVELQQHHQNEMSTSENDKEEIFTPEVLREYIRIRSPFARNLLTEFFGTAMLLRQDIQQGELCLHMDTVNEAVNVRYPMRDMALKYGPNKAMFANSPSRGVVRNKDNVFDTVTTSPDIPNCYLCYGAVVRDGYGCSYNLQNDTIIFAPSAFKSNPRTNLAAFKDSIRSSLYDMRSLLINSYV